MQYPEQSTSARPNKRSADSSELPYSYSPAQKARTESGEQEDLTEVQYSEETIPADLKKCASLLSQSQLCSDVCGIRLVPEETSVQQV